MPTDSSVLSQPTGLASPSLLLRAALAAFCIGLTLWLLANAGDLNSSTQAGVVLDLPEQIGDFKGTPGEISDAERAILPGDTEFARMNYVNSQGDMISVSIVLSGSEKRSIHRPEICLPGQGWSIGAGSVIPVPLVSGRTLDVMQLDISRPVEVRPGEFQRLRSKFLYWFVGKDITTPLHQVRIFKTSWDRVFRKTNHRWAYVIVSAVVGDSVAPGGRSADETTRMLKDFIREIVPYFQTSEMSAASASASKS